ncbi:MAG: restriction endonuclease [Legionella sp.]|jgi:restriction system protein
MAIPNYQTFMLPVLKSVNGNEPLKYSTLIELVTNQFNFSPDEKKELIPSSKMTVLKNRIGWAKSYLKQAGLLFYPQRGFVSLTPLGNNVLAKSPETIDTNYLKQFPDFLAFLDRNSSSNKPLNTNEDLQNATPDELMEQTYSTLKSKILDELIDTIKTCSPQFFEQLVVDVILSMGYGGSRREAGKAIGQTGDAGIDGVINEDRLGLDVIYLQAKRWEAVVGRPEIQKFVGALQGKRAKKGVFITTSGFTKGAKEFVEHIDCKIVLLSGVQLAELMWEYNIGLHQSATYEIKSLDQDYFNEDSE